MIIIIDNFLDNDYLNQLVEMVEQGKRIKLDSSGPHVMKEKTDYDWYMISSDIRKSDLKNQLLDKIELLTNEKIQNRDSLTPIHLFAKEFDKNSYCAPHFEDPKIYGNWTFMLYLTDEVDGELTAEGISILPKKNRLVLMKTGDIHTVNQCSGRRLNIAGWPYATDEVFNRWKSSR
jgi:hypothetical protein